MTQTDKIQVTADGVVQTIKATDPETGKSYERGDACHEFPWTGYFFAGPVLNKWEYQLDGKTPVLFELW